MFHSIWRTPENEYVDVTQSDVYGNDKVATFWHDSTKIANLDEGIAYNSVIALENVKPVQTIARGTNTQLSVGTHYWTENRVRFFSGLDEHRDTYRMLHGDYPKITKMLEEQYNCRSEGNCLVSNNKDKKVQHRYSSTSL